MNTEKDEMSRKGLVFDIKQMALFDGPGIRTTVFLKGCPLKCQWCHNPEGISPEPQLMVAGSGCIECGLCKTVCNPKERCTACGACVNVCPAGIRRIAGRYYDSDGLAAELLKDKLFLEKQQGGVTFSGGEPLLQAAFVFEVIDKLQGMHTAIETSGYCSEAVFTQMLEKVDYILMDIKMINEDEHKKYTGVSNRIILKNLEQMKKSAKPFILRIPLIPGVNDTEQNMCLTAKLIEDAVNLQRVELLRYQKTAGAKYGMLGMDYTPEFDTEREAETENKGVFERYGIDCVVL